MIYSQYDDRMGSVNNNLIYALFGLLALMATVVRLVRSFSTLNPLLARRSVVKYDLSQKVPLDAIDRALNAAVLAPNHFLTAPWRFYTCGPETKRKLCNMNEDKRKMAEGVPEWLVVTLDSEHELDEKLGLEDHAATAAAIHSFMLSLAREGIASKWMTGALGVGPDVVKKVVGAPEQEHFMGAVWFGYPAEPLSEDSKKPKRKKDITEVVKNLP